MTTDDFDSERERFYRERDLRTSEYLENDSPASAPVSIHVSADACETQAGQLLLLALVNQLARIHRELRFAVAAPDTALLTPTLCGASTLGTEICRVSQPESTPSASSSSIPKERPRNASPSASAPIVGVTLPGIWDSTAPMPSSTPSPAGPETTHRQTSEALASPPRLARRRPPRRL